VGCFVSSLLIHVLLIFLNSCELRPIIFFMSYSLLPSAFISHPIDRRIIVLAWWFGCCQ